jgi:peroxiredoxin
MPGINELYLKEKDNKNIVFIMDDVDGNPGKSLQFMAKHQYNLPVHSLMGKIPANLADGTIPTTFVVDKSGHIAYKHVGSADYSNPKMLAYLNQLAAAK